MPRKHSLKIYVENGYYHIYNRGVEKRDVFLDDQDYRVFLHLLKYYLSPSKDKLKHPLSNLPNYKITRPRPLKNLYGEVELLAYCLMPNHFHLLLKQITKDGMKKLMLKLTTTYSMYFNKRYDRVGYLFQGNYKAILITKDEYLLHLSRYIHLNPIELTGATPVSYRYSSYPNYLALKNTNWVKPNFILNFFKTDKMIVGLLHYPSYKEFVEDKTQDIRDVLGDLTIDLDQ